MSEIDYSKTNPSLHYLYVTWAMQHLNALRVAIKKLSHSSGNSNWDGPVSALIEERAKLLKNDTAYQEAAWRILAGHIVKDRPLDDLPEGGISYPASTEPGIYTVENLSIYDTVSETWIEKPAPGIFKPESHVMTVGDAQALGALKNNGEPGYINSDAKTAKDATPVSETKMSRRDRRRQKRTQSFQGKLTQAQVVTQAHADRKRRKQMTNGLYGIWIYGPQDTTPRQLHETYGTSFAAEREAKKYRIDTGRACKISKPNGCWSPEA